MFRISNMFILSVFVIIVMATSHQLHRIRFQTPSSPDCSIDMYVMTVIILIYWQALININFSPLVLCTGHGQKTQVIQRETLMPQSIKYCMTEDFRSRTDIIENEYCCCLIYELASNKPALKWWLNTALRLRGEYVVRPRVEPASDGCKELILVRHNHCR